MSSENSSWSDDRVQLVDDDPRGVDDVRPRLWRVLVVDDDEDVHRVTRFALAGITILDRPIELLHARSAAEARRRAHETADIAVALVDVVMETPDAGLALVRDLREAGFREMRIVLRTGQPGYAPELSVISTYEIDDYRTKAELTQTRLLTVLTSCIRAYDQISTITRVRTGLEMIVESATELFRRTNLQLFSRGVLSQIGALLGVAPDGFVCVNAAGGPAGSDMQILSAMGRFAHHIGERLDVLEDAEARALLAQVRDHPEPVLQNGYMALHFRCESGRELAALIETNCRIAPADLTLLKLFSTNIAVGFENLELLEKLDRLAYLDPDLGVPNLNAFEAALDEHLASDRPNGRMALTSVDSFQSIVAAYGPRVANAFLRSVYGALVHEADASLTVARIGDGSFALLGDRGALDERLVPAAFDKPHEVDNIEIATTATTAILELDDVAAEPASIMRKATAALLHVKRARRGTSVVYDAAMQAEAERRAAIQVAMKRGLERGDGFALHLQPKFNLGTGELVGAEALLRWTHKTTAVPPAEFIPIAESTGLIQPLTEFVVHAVGRWSTRRGRGTAMPVAVNLSMVDLNNPGFATRLIAQVQAAGLTPDTVEFEITEGIAMHDTPWPTAQVRTLKEAGFRIALDDFGTGYSSLSQINRLPVDTLKIDRSFVSRLTVRTARQSLAAVAIAMAQALKIECVAEGIETAEQNQALLVLGCSFGQGFHIGRPVPIEEFDARFPQHSPYR